MEPGIIRNVCTDDLALCELFSGGGTSAPAEVLQRLADRGHLTIAADRRPTLTGAGHERAARLVASGAEHDLRLEAENRRAGKSSICTVGGAALRLTGGVPVTIRS